MATPRLRRAQNPEADELLARDPLALLIGMLLDQRVPLEWAFGAPYRLAQRLGTDSLDAGEIAAHDPEAFTGLMVGPPARSDTSIFMCECLLRKGSAQGTRALVDRQTG